MIIEEILETFINGNRKDAIREFLKLSHDEQSEFINKDFPPQEESFTSSIYGFENNELKLCEFLLHHLLVSKS